MKIPDGKTKEEVLAAIEKAVDILGPSFVFGYFDIDDIKQHGRMEAIKVLATEKYDPALPLENFLYSHIKFRLINLNRDKNKRSDTPCKSCHKGIPCNDGVLCEKYTVWLKRNTAKANLIRPLNIGNISEEKSTTSASTVHQDAEIEEALRLIDEQLPVELRAVYLQMRAGVSVNKLKRLQVEREIKAILRGEIECPSEED